MPLEQSDVPDTVSVDDYFSQAFLPEIRRPSSTESYIDHVKKARPWPRYAELQRESGTRLLVEIRPAPTVDFISQTQQYKRDTLARVYLRHGTKIDKAAADNLVLPSKGCVEYDAKDVKILSNVYNEQVYMQVLKHYVFGTLADGLRLIRDQSTSLTIPPTASLKFVDCSHLCSARHPRWEILALEGTLQHPRPFFIFCIPNYELGIDDFSQFIGARNFEKGEIDQPSTIAQTLWAVIHDTCQNGGRFFAVTNYTRWAFGEISRARKLVAISQALDAPILRFDGSYNPTQGLGCSIFEMVLFWAQWSFRAA